MRNHGKKLPRGRKELMCPPGTRDGVVECTGWNRKRYEGQQEREMGPIGRDSQAVVLRSSLGTPLEDLKQWRDLICILKGHSGCYVESIECRQSTWI